MTQERTPGDASHGNLEAICCNINSNEGGREDVLEPTQRNLHRWSHPSCNGIASPLALCRDLAAANCASSPARCAGHRRNPSCFELAKKLLKKQFGSDLLAGISILVAVVLEQYLVATIVVLMLSGGAALEFSATAKASSVLDALARRMPSVAHRREGSRLYDVKLEDIRVGDELAVFPHEICPVDGDVLEGHGVMDEAYLTGEPYEMSKTPGSQVISGVINGGQALTIRAEKLVADSRYARIMRVMHETEQQKPRLRRLGDQLGAWYTPLALVVAAAAGFLSADAHRFLAVVVIATPCPLLLAIPTAIGGAIFAFRTKGDHHQESRNLGANRFLPNTNFR